MADNLPASAGDSGSIPDPGRPPREGNGGWLQYSCLGNPIDRRAWWAIVCGVTKSWPRRSDSAADYEHIHSGVYLLSDSVNTSVTR